MSRRIAAVLSFAAVVFVLFAGCGNNTGDPTKTVQSSTAQVQKEQLAKECVRLLADTSVVFNTKDGTSAPAWKYQVAGSWPSSRIASDYYVMMHVRSAFAKIDTLGGFDWSKDKHFPRSPAGVLGAIECRLAKNTYKLFSVSRVERSLGGSFKVNGNTFYFNNPDDLMQITLSALSGAVLSPDAVGLSVKEIRDAFLYDVKANELVNYRRLSKDPHAFDGREGAAGDELGPIIEHWQIKPEELGLTKGEVADLSDYFARNFDRDE